MKSAALIIFSAVVVGTSHGFQSPSRTSSQQQVQCHPINKITNSQLYMSSSNNDDDDDDDSSSLRIMVNGMPGPMATAAAEACLRKGLSLSPIAMTGPDIKEQTITVTDDITGKSAEVRLIPANDDGRTEIISSLSGLREASGKENILAIDYTHPSAVNDNAIFYAENELPFVMGTTGGDRDQLMSDML